MKLTHVSVTIKDIEEGIRLHRRYYRLLKVMYPGGKPLKDTREIIKKLQSYLPED